MRNIPALMSEMVSDKASCTWLELWKNESDRRRISNSRPPLDVAVRYKETKGDRRVLPKFPIEERNH